MGPLKQIKRMFAATRIIATIIVLVRSLTHEFTNYFVITSYFNGTNYIRVKCNIYSNLFSFILRAIQTKFVTFLSSMIIYSKFEGNWLIYIYICSILLQICIALTFCAALWVSRKKFKPLIAKKIVGPNSKIAKLIFSPAIRHCFCCSGRTEVYVCYSASYSSSQWRGILYHIFHLQGEALFI